MDLWKLRAWIAEATPRPDHGADGTVRGWISDLDHAVRWWIRWGVWSPPTRRQCARPIGARPWPLPAGRRRSGS